MGASADERQKEKFAPARMAADDIGCEAFLPDLLAEFCTASARIALVSLCQQ